MEKLETQQEVINLGKLFVKELKLESGVDTFSKWIAHYIAEKIKTAETSTGEQRVKAQKECYDAILKLWKHRWLLPAGTRPFEDFQQILKVIKKLDPEKEQSFYYDRPEKSLGKIAGSKLSQEWLTITQQIDKAARICLEYSLTRAATGINNKKTTEWLNNISTLTTEDDTRIIKIIISKDFSFEPEDNSISADDEKKYAKEKIKSRIEQLEKFASLNKKVLNSLKSDLKELD